MVVTRRKVGTPKIGMPKIGIGGAGRSLSPSWMPGGRSLERRLMWGAIAVTLLGLLQVYFATSDDFDSIRAELAAGTILLLDQTTTAEDLTPLLTTFADPEERAYAGEQLTTFLAEQSSLPNVGELGRLRIPVESLEGASLPLLQARAQATSQDTVRLLSRRQLRELKNLVVVRAPGHYRNQVAMWSLALVTALLAVHFLWAARGFGGDQLILPSVAVLVGIGLCLMISVRDPLRDLLLFRAFAQGVIGGCVLLAAASLLDVERSRLKTTGFWALGAAVGLSLLLIFFGSGPGTSDAKVNLFGFQPVEAIKVLVVLFLAAYFSQRWELLRHLDEARPELPGAMSRIKLPKLDYVLPPIAAMGLVLAFFFVQRDLGPALVLSFLFLCLYYVARGRTIMVAVCTGLLVLGFFVGYQLRVPHTVAGRIDMWLNPWDNAFRGGEHLAQSLWAFAAGGISGTGLGRGHPGFVPEVHTDMVLSAIGEELGLVGVLAVLLIYVVLIQRCFLAVLRAGGVYSFFLSLGLCLVLALQIALIAGGVLGVLPLSGVVTPFLSYGRSAMLANFLVLGLLLAISARPAPRTDTETSDTATFRTATFRLAGGLAVLLFLVGAKATVVNAARADSVLIRGTRAIQADGQRRYLYNPRLLDISRRIERGPILDRNGIVLATGDPADLALHSATYESLGVTATPPVAGSRAYPFGGRMFHLLGNVNSRVNWGARNTSFVERDHAARLQGFDDRLRESSPSTDSAQLRDYSALVPLVRRRGRKRDKALEGFLSQDRSVQLSVDARLQLAVARALERQIRSANLSRGAAVVLDAASGDVLASVSYPWPEANPRTADPDSLLDRARYGVYPPGSTFKLVTAIAALRKNPALGGKKHTCKTLQGGRVGNSVRGWKAPIRDDPTVRSPHGSIDLFRAIARSCNAYFAQLATYDVGPQDLLDTAAQFGIEVAQPNTFEKARDLLPQAGYGQGQVLVTPFEMARVAATLARGGDMPQGRWVTDDSNTRTEPPRRILDPEDAERIVRAMRRVVTEGSAARAMAGAVTSVAGKTGTAQVAGRASHSWFAGFAPYNDGAQQVTGMRGKKVAFAVLIENGGYGGGAATKVAKQVVREAARLGLVR